MGIFVFSQVRRQDRVLVSLCFSLIGLYVAFIISSFARFFETHDPPNGMRGCALFSAVLQYFILAYLIWTMAEALLTFLTLYKGMKVGTTVFLVASLACWGKPLLVAHS